MIKIDKFKNIKYNINSTIMIVSVIVIALLINFLLSPGVLKTIAGKDTLKWDMTPNRVFSIGSTTDQILKNMKKNVEIYVLYNDNMDEHSDEKNIMEFLGKYEKYGNVKVQKVNPDKNPGIMKKIDPDGAYGLLEDDIVVKCGKKIKKYNSEELYMENEYEENGDNKWNGEQVITGAIKYVTSDASHVIYFTLGHEERQAFSEFKTLKDYIQQNSMDVKNLNLISVDKVPDDADIIVFPSPKTDLTVQEKNKVSDYLAKGGNVIFMFDYLDPSPSFSQFQEILKFYCISLNNDKVKESSDKSLPNDAYSLITMPENTILNADLYKKGSKILMPDCRSINILNTQKASLTVAPLIKTSSASVGEQIDKTAEKNKNGPLNIVVAAEYTGQQKPSRILVTGTSGFITDDILSKSPFAINFILNDVKWMQISQNDLSIQPKSIDMGTLQMNASNAKIASAVLVIVIPLLILGIGLFVWLRRRHL